ncbi:GPN-loop GTPase 2-like isoform X2 [Montipora capricornis]|uniref:GPN-loop GTPase 2-like isoform X2 n=1 Tax=Montipora capricornis TaxID=246305 RepID=UPI0035F198ED
MPSFGQIVIGPPGSGKSTFCAGMSDFLTSLGRKVAVVNLDPANESLYYKCAVDISTLITLDDVMESLKLGPNGGLIYCIEYLEKNIDWLEAKLKELSGHYFLFDCPGQVELYTHHNSVRNVVRRLEKWDFRLTAVHLVDAHHCSDPAKFISVLLTSLSTMIHIELPHVNVLSKIDLVEQYGKLAFNLDFYTDVLDLNYLLDHIKDDPFTQKYKKLNEALVGLVEDYGLVSFRTLDVQSKESMYQLIKSIDQANGYVFGGLEDDRSNFSQLMSSAVGTDFEFFRTAAVQEKYMEEEEDKS